MRKRKQQTRKRVRKNSRRQHKSHRHKRHRLRGGNYVTDVTKRTIDDMPVTDKAVISMAGQPPMSVDAFKRHALYRDFQGPEQ